MKASVCVPQKALSGLGIILEGDNYRNIEIRPGADCGSVHELLITKFKFKLKKVEKTTRSFRYDLNQIPYKYTVEVTNRLKGLDLIECLKSNGWKSITLYRRW